MSLANSDSLSALSTLRLFRDIILFPGEPERQLWSAKTIPEKCTYEGALQGTYLERESVHVGTLLYTHVYTTSPLVVDVGLLYRLLRHRYIYREPYAPELFDLAP